MILNRFCAAELTLYFNLKVKKKRKKEERNKENYVSNLPIQVLEIMLSSPPNWSLNVS